MPSRRKKDDNDEISMMPFIGILGIGIATITASIAYDYYKNKKSKESEKKDEISMEPIPNKGPVILPIIQELNNEKEKSNTRQKPISIYSLDNMPRRSKDTFYGTNSRNLTGGTSTEPTIGIADILSTSSIISNAEPQYLDGDDQIERKVIIDEVLDKVLYNLDRSIDNTDIQENVMKNVLSEFRKYDIKQKKILTPDDKKYIELKINTY